MTAKSFLIGCGIVAIVVLGAVAAVGAWFYSKVNVYNIDATVSAPLSVETEQPFDITVHVRNTADKPQSLVDVDVAKDYVSGIAIRSATPPFKESTTLITGGTSMTFDQPIPARGELVVVLHAVGLKEGDFSGDVDMCINSSFGFVTQQARTVVTAKGVAAQP